MTMSRAEFDESSFLNSGNAHYIAELYAQYLENPASVDQSWADFFTAVKDGKKEITEDLLGATWQPKDLKIIGNDNIETTGPIVGNLPAVVAHEHTRKATLDSIRALMFIRAYRVRGHLEASLDPLGIVERAKHPELDPKTYGFSESDFNHEIFIDGVLGYESASLRQIVERCRATYCGHIGVEFMHMQDPAQKAWIQARMEGKENHTDFTTDQKKAILKNLTKAEVFERFLHKKYQGTKRFGIDGGEAIIPLLEETISTSAALEVEEMVVGMAHRGRLNLLANILRKPYVKMMSEFEGNSSNPDDISAAGDVKYHLGYSSDREINGKKFHLTMSANPSHLEAVNPIVTGRVRSKQDMYGDTDRRRVMGVLLHGDAAIAGQGLTAETFMMSQLQGYRCGGTLHVVINNQIGFTTNPIDGRSSPYCSDVAKMVQAPIFHVNGDDPEAVVHVAKLAAEFRHTFQSDIVVDMFCYRRFGHNESDEPMFTQPLMYKAIAKQSSTREIYVQQLVDAGEVSQVEADDLVEHYNKELDAAHEAAKTYKPNKADWLEGAWKGLTPGKGKSRTDDVVTGVDVKTLKKVGEGLTTTPDNFDVNRKIARQLETKQDMFKAGENFDWATAEALAFGTLLLEDHPVRLSGQDCGRGTFSQRHAVLRDQSTGERYVYLNHLDKKQAHFEVLDSPLAEASVLGFDYGYSLANPNALVCWEAQFGDFVNGAQVIIDQFISSAESKWLRMSALTLLLPHGYEGQGPEHSSARPERFLQLCAEDNMIVANITTPANYFHVLRRQMKRDFRKPLIIMTPKSLLRHKLCISKLDEMAGKTTFTRVYGEVDKLAAAKQVKRIVLCTGKVYYDLLEARREANVDNVAIIRVEQLYPFPHKEIVAELKKYPQAESVIWCQEEPENMGYWRFIDRRLEAAIVDAKAKTTRPQYVGRAAAASPATGYLKRHLAEQAGLVKDALDIK